MRPRKAEREQLVALLDEPWDSVDDLANAVFNAAASMLMARDWWVLVQATNSTLMVFGPYGTTGQAQKALVSLEFLAEDTKVFVRKLAVVGSLEEDDDA